jgi:hypothetical protein
MIQLIPELRRPKFSDQLMSGLGRAASAASTEIPKVFGEKMLQKEMSSFADKIENNNPDSPIHKTLANLYRSGLPLDRKSEIAKSLIGIDPFKMDQQARLRRDEVRKSYNQRIKEEQNKRKELFKTEDIMMSDHIIKKLQNERDQLLGFELEQEPKEEMMEIKEEPEKKVKFNPANPSHMSKFKQLDKEFKGDKKKVNKALAKEFTL